MKDEALTAAQQQLRMKDDALSAAQRAVTEAAADRDVQMKKLLKGQEEVLRQLKCMAEEFGPFRFC